MKRFAILLTATLLAGNTGWGSGAAPEEECRNGEFQFSAGFNNAGVDGKEARDFTAYLWIPPSVGKLRGVILTQQNVGEQVFIEHPAIRQACADNGLAIVWSCPAADLRFEHRREAAARLQEEVLRTLGKISGYEELGTVPWITFGHSSTTQFARSLAETRPDRTIAILSAKGGVTLPTITTHAIPGLYSGGHFPEWRQPTHDWTKQGASLPGLGRLRDALRERWRPASYIEEYGGGHFDYSEPFLEFLALYIRKAVHSRLREDGSLRPIGTDEGFVVDMRLPLPLAPLTIVPSAEAEGELRNAPWFFDREIAEAAVRLMDGGDWNRKNQIVAFANLDGTPAKFAKNGIADPVPCEMAGDGVTIRRIRTTFLTELPANFTQAGMKFSHASSGKSTLERVSGVFAVENGRYRIKLNRGYPEVPNFILVRHPGDERHRPSVQPARLAVPDYKGRRQSISFAPIKDQKAGFAEVPLEAKSSAGLPVEFFVRSGPAKVVGDKLVLLPLPPRARLPVKVTVVAWQLGRPGAKPVAAAPMVERSFFLN